MTVLAAGAPPSHTVLLTAAVLGIAVVVLLITALRVHPFLALIAGSAVLGIVGGLGAQATIDSFEKGVGATVGSVGLLIALGAMIGGLLADSGGADWNRSAARRAGHPSSTTSLASRRRPTGVSGALA